MENLIKQFCKSNKLKFEDFNLNSNILLTSIICSSYYYKDSFASKKEVYKYRFFEYYKVINYGNYIDCIAIFSEKKPINYIGGLITANMINRLNYEQSNL